MINLLTYITKMNDEYSTISGSTHFKIIILKDTYIKLNTLKAELKLFPDISIRKNMLKYHTQLSNTHFGNVKLLLKRSEFNISCNIKKSEVFNILENIKAEEHKRLVSLVRGSSRSLVPLAS